MDGMSYHVGAHRMCVGTQEWEIGTRSRGGIDCHIYREPAKQEM